MTKTQARVLLPNRGQMELRASGLESLLPEGHRVRLVWAYVERQDLKGFYEDNRAVEGGVGRSAIAPEILLGLWLYATLDGVGSAREITRLTEAHDAYRWLCGGAQVNDHTLSDLSHGSRRSAGRTVEREHRQSGGGGSGQAQAGGVGRHAGAGQCRGGIVSAQGETEGYPEAARAEVARLKAEWARDSARRRAAHERQARLEKALARVPELSLLCWMRPILA